MYKTLTCGEQAFDAYSRTDVICHVYEAKKMIGYHTMTNSNCNEHKEESYRFNGIGFGVNVFLRRHTDMDFTLSIVQVHIDNCYFGMIIELYLTSVFQGWGLQCLYVLVSTYCSIQRSHIVYHHPMVQTICCIPFHVI
jgi:hypothetical protein